MAINDFDVREPYTGTGSLADYTFDFKLDALTSLLVKEYTSAGVLVHSVTGDDTSVLISSVALNDDNVGGTITLLSNLTSGHRLVILLANDEPLQESQFINKFDFTLKRLEDALDAIVGPAQRLAYLASRAVRLDDFDASTGVFDPTLPPMAGNAGRIPTTNALGTGWDLVSAWTPTTDLTTAVSSAAAAATSASNASASSIAATASAAAALVSQTAAATSATNAAGSETAALGYKNTATTQATAAAASATAAAASANTASTQATNASTSAAASSASSTTSTNQATASAASAAAALASQSAAAASAVAALGSQVAAAASAVDAAASAASAAAAAAGVAPDIVGTRAGPTAVVAANGIVFTSTRYFNIHFLQGSGGAVDISKDPQIQAGTVLGQQLRIEGCSDTNTIRLENGTGIKLKDGSAELFLFADSIATFMWDGVNWVQA